MKRNCFIFFIALAFSKATNAQNLVENGGFENVSACPNNVGLIENAFNWYNPTTSTPDLFHECSPLDALTPPTLTVAYEPTFSGGAYSEIASSQVNSRDYIENELNYGLQINLNYCVNLFISHADSLMHKLDSLDIHLSDTFVYYFNVNKVIPLSFPTYTFPSISISNIGWTNIQFIYSAYGGEKFMTLGNFDDDANSVYVNSGYGIYPGAYYLIDSVSISQCRPPNLGSDTVTIYEGDQIMIGDTAMDVALYSWFPTQGLSNPNEWQTLASPAVTTTYMLTKITPCDTTFASKTVVVNGTFLNIFPNPSQNIISYNYGIGSRVNGKIKLFDCTGRLIYQELLLNESGSSVIDVNLASGIYILKLESGDEILETEKLIVNN